MIVGTAGHIDHGKTALVRALTGVDTDRLPEERRRGMTIELGFAPLALDDGTVASIVDVPGHERYVDTMTAGASSLDAAILVVAAGEGVMPQTREHCAVLRALGVPIVAIALSKIDRIPYDAREAAIENVRRSLDQCAVPAATPIIATSSVSNEGIETVRLALAAAAARVSSRDLDDLFRLVVDRVFTIRGTGTVVTGAVWSGSVAVGARVRALPSGREWRIRAVQTHGAAAERATAGARFALALADAAPADIARGATLVTDAAWASSSRLVVRVDVGNEEVRLSRTLSVQLGGTRARARWTGADPRLLLLALDRPLVARRGDRLVLRTGASVNDVIGALVADPLPERGQPVAGDSAAEHLSAVARAAGIRGLRRSHLAVRLGVSPRDIGAILSAAELAQVGDVLLSRDALKELAARVVQLIEDDSRAHPFADGLAIETVRAEVGAAHALVDAAVSLLVGERRVTVREGRLSFAPGALSPDAERLLARVLHWAWDAGLVGVSGDEAMDAFGAVGAAVLTHAERRGNLIRIGGVRYCEASVIAGAVERLRGAMRSGRECSPSELRGVLGVSRKHLIPLLEYCDAVRVTVRRSGGRVLADVSSR